MMEIANYSFAAAVSLPPASKPLAHAGHGQNIHIYAIAEGKRAQHAFLLKAKFPIQRDCSTIVHVDIQFDPLEIQPIVRQ